MRFLRLSALMAAMLFSAVFLLGILSLRGRAACPGGPGAGQGATRNGDVNCDGKVNISDPIYLLESLFRGGPEPCALAQNAEVCCQDLLDGLKKVEAAISSIHPWPPQPENIVNMSGELHFRGEVIPIYTVPEDKWLLVTDLDGSPGWALVEVLGDKETPKRHASPPFSSPVGLTFAPGSKAAIKPLSTNTPLNGSYALIGYLTVR